MVKFTVDAGRSAVVCCAEDEGVALDEFTEEELEELVVEFNENFAQEKEDNDG